MDKQKRVRTNWYKTLWYHKMRSLYWQNLIKCRAKWLGIMAVLVIAGLLGRVSVIGATAPFGIGLFVAVFVYSPVWAWRIFTSVLVGAFTSREIGEVLLLISSVLLFWQGSIHWVTKKRTIRLPILCGASSLVVGWAYQILIGGSLYNGLLVLFSSLLSVLFAYLVIYGLRIFVIETKRDDLTKTQIQEGFLTMTFVLALAVSGIGDLVVFDYGVQMIAGSFLALGMLAVMELGSALAGCIGLGFVIGIGDGNVSMTMAEYAFAGLLGGALRSMGKIGVILGFLIGLGSMLLCFDPYGALWYMMGEAAIGAVLFALIPICYLRELRQYLSAVSLQGGSERRIEQVRDKLHSLEVLFSYMAEIGAKKDSQAEDTNHQCQTATILSAVEEVACSTCEKKKNCWEEDFFVVSREMLSLVDRHEERQGEIESFQNRCPRSATIVATLEKAMREQSQSRYWKLQCSIQQSILSQQMGSISAILRQLAMEVVPYQEAYQKKREQIGKRLDAWGCKIEELTIPEEDEGGRIELGCPACGGKRICEARILPYLERMLGMRLRMSVICGTQNHFRRCRLFFTTQERIQILTGMVGFGAAEEAVSGDTCEMIPISQGKIAIVLSDGMGCGKKAADDSREAVYLFKALLTAGFELEVALQMVNSLGTLRAEKERFATIDVLVINKYTAMANFVKIGAAPAFIKRQSEVMVMQNDSVPLGVMGTIAVKPIGVQLEDGDFVVMMSDGVLDIPPERVPNGHTKESWIRSQIRIFSGKSPQVLAEQLAQTAIRLSGKTIQDDMTVVVAKIKTVSRG